jgi:hypothetical protein
MEKIKGESTAYNISTHPDASISIISIFFLASTDQVKEESFVKKPSKYLLDQLIKFIHANDLSFEEGAKILGSYAKQRVPGYELEKANTEARVKLLNKIGTSKEEYLIVRFLVRTRVRYIRWTYYPEFHVVSRPRDYWWHSIKFKSPSWRAEKKKGYYYLDDLFFSSYDGLFWMPEPYLSGLPTSRKLFEKLRKLKFGFSENLYQRVDPVVIEKFKEARKGIAGYIKKDLSDGLSFRRPAYGSKGWQKRIKFLPKTSKLVRLER